MKPWGFALAVLVVAACAGGGAAPTPSASPRLAGDAAVSPSPRGPGARLGPPATPTAQATPAARATPSPSATPVALLPPLAPPVVAPAAPSTATPAPSPVATAAPASPTTFALAGRITNASGVPLKDAPVIAVLGGGAACCTVVASASTDASGSYVLQLRPGAYRLRALPPVGSGLAARWWRDASEFSSATDIPITVAGLSGVDLRLSAAAIATYLVTGAVTNSQTGTGIEGVTIRAYPGGSGASCVGCASVASARTDSSGGYTLSLASGTYRIEFVPPAGYAGQWWKGGSEFAAATDVTVSGANVGGVSVALKPTFFVSGTVSSRTSGTPIAGVVVGAYPGGAGATCSACAAVATATTDVSGSYALTVPLGTYRFLFTPPGDHQPQWWSNASDFSKAADILVQASITISPGL